MKYRIKTIAAVIISAIALSMSSSRAEEATTDSVINSDNVVVAKSATREWSISIDGIRPGDDVFWDKGVGGTLKYTFMQTPTRGYALSAGVQNWDVNEEIYLIRSGLSGGGVGAYASQITGDAQLVPLSAFGVLRHELSPGLHLGLEAGLSYVIVNSNVKYEEALGAARGGQGFIVSDVSDVEIDNGLVAIFAADLRYQPNPSSKWTWFAGVGGQADLSKGKVVYPYTPISGYGEGESELKALFFRAGLASTF